MWNPPAIVYSYEYNGKTVYGYVMSELLDSKGNRICSPDGEITGQGDSKCNDFFSTRSDEKII